MPYCAHRIEVELEPACVIVCPVQAIIPGDLDDPNSRIARLVASQQVSVRKPEQGTQPKLFYLGADEASLTPAMQERGGRYAFAEGSRIPMPGGSNVASFEPAASNGHEGVDLLRMARTVYDVAHPERPWGWKVSTYLWTKSIAAGVFLLAALGLVSGLASGGAVTARATPLIGLAFLALTTALLVFDLKRPERFLYLLFKPNWRSWLVWGGWILLAQGAVGGLWLLAGWQGNGVMLQALAWPMLPLAAAAAGYSAFLFGQAEGRDFWQSPLLLPHLLVAAVTAGAASLLLAGEALGRPDLVTHDLLAITLWVSLGVEGLALVAELCSFHATQDSARAAKILTHGPLRVPFWVGVALCGIALPWVDWPPTASWRGRSSRSDTVFGEDVGHKMGSISRPRSRPGGRSGTIGFNGRPASL